MKSRISLILIGGVIGVIISVIAINAIYTQRNVDIKEILKINDNISAHLIDYDWNYYNSDNNVAAISYFNEEDIYMQIKEKLKDIPFTEIDNTLLIDLVVCDSNIDLITQDEAVKNSRTFKFKDVNITLIDEELNAKLSETINISDNQFKLDISNLPDDRNIYILYELEPVYSNNDSYGNQVEYAMKIRT